MAQVGEKRKAEYSSSTAIVVKKQKTEMVVADERTSNLHAPIMLLTGHQAEIHTLKFSPDGQNLASAGADKLVFLWNIYGEECNNIGAMKGHKNTVLELCWSSDSDQIFTASADKTAAVWSVERQKIIKRMTEHSSYVSSICPSKSTIGDSGKCVTCSDDGTAKVWDLRQRSSSLTLAHQYPLTAVCFDETADNVYTGGIDNLIHSWDIRKPNTELFRLLGHQDTITCLRLDPFGSYILSNGMDGELRVWDIRPFAPMQRCIKVFSGAQHNFEQNLIKCNWSADGTYVGAGSADRLAYIWDTTTRQLRYKLPGHEGSVNEVAFHPKEPIIGSCCSGQRIYIGEISKSTF